MKKEIKKKIKAINLFFEEGSKNFNKEKKILLARDWMEKFIEAEEYELAEFMKDKRNELLGIKKKKIGIIRRIINFLNK